MVLGAALVGMAARVATAEHDPADVVAGAGLGLAAEGALAALGPPAVAWLHGTRTSSRSRLIAPALTMTVSRFVAGLLTLLGILAVLRTKGQERHLGADGSSRSIPSPAWSGWSSAWWVSR